MNKYFISVLNYLTAYALFLQKTFFFFDQVIIVERKKIMKGPDLEFGEFLQFIGIGLTMKKKTGTTWSDCSSKNPLYIFSG